MTAFSKKIVLFLSIPLAALIIITGSIGLFTPGFYARETINWTVQSTTQDAIDIFLITPVLLITAIAALKSKVAFLLWGGVNFYLAYTYAIYCFDVHFNSMFPLYCLSLGLSFNASLYFLFSLHNKESVNDLFNKMLTKIIAVYFLIIAILFYFLWLSEILPAAMHHKAPQVLTDTGLPTNPVHVLDLSIVLPAIFIVGILILRKNTRSLFLAPAILVFFILMDITIAALSVAMNAKGPEAGYSILVIMSLLTLFTLSLLLWHLKNLIFSLNVLKADRV